MQDLSARFEGIKNELSQTSNANENFLEQIKALQLRISDNQRNMEKEAFQRYSELLGTLLL
jgi:hypothetical protein